MHTGFPRGNTNERVPFKDPGVYRRRMLKWGLKKWDSRDVDWINLAQDRWRHLVNMVLIRNMVEMKFCDTDFRVLNSCVW
jgi:hypothetical protein